MFGTRKTTTAPGEAGPAATASRPAPRSPGEALKPVAAPPPPPPRVRRPRGGLLSMLSGMLTLGLAVGATVVFGLLLLEREVSAPGPLSSDKVVLIPRGSGTGEIAQLLQREGVISSPQLFELYAYLQRRKGQLRAGEFLFPAHVDIEEAIDTLLQGKAILHSFTVPEGLTSEQIVARMKDNEILSGEVREIPREGSLLPDTYRFERGTTRQQLVNMMQAAERDALAKAWQRKAPDVAIRTPQELVILASIVEKETGRGDERGRVAGVFLNRLARRMKLQSDPTIVYGLVGGKGTLGRGILRSEIERPTPYNTYVIEGLPPGPIANPGRAALEAVANPVRTKDLYFVADGTGGHVFAETYDQHQRNVARWRALERQKDEAATRDNVDRVEPPAGPENRSEGGAASPRASASAEAGGRTGAAFDAVEGTARDPLRSQGWDLSSPKTVPAFAPEPGDARPARSDRRDGRSRRDRQAAGSESGARR